MGRVGEKKIRFLSIQNLSNNPIILVPSSSSPYISFDRITIPENEVSDIACEVVLPPGRANFRYQLKDGTLTVPIQVDTYGYHLMTEDVAEGDEFNLPNVFQYYRTGTEALLNVFGTDSEEGVERIPLSRRTTDV